jgi:hypothetical protein
MNQDNEIIVSDEELHTHKKYSSYDFNKKIWIDYLPDQSYLCDTSFCLENPIVVYEYAVYDESDSSEVYAYEKNFVTTNNGTEFNIILPDCCVYPNPLLKVVDEVLEKNISLGKVFCEISDSDIYFNIGGWHVTKVKISGDGCDQILKYVAHVQDTMKKILLFGGTSELLPEIIGPIQKLLVCTMNLHPARSMTLMYNK